MTKTLGERRVRTQFNPSNDGFIDTIKQKSARLIDLVDKAVPPKDLTEEDFKEFKRLQALALTNYEQAAMWAVKAFTI